MEPSRGQSKRHARGAWLRAATLAQSASAATIGSVLIVHLAAPVAASLGGADMANQTMLLGREYYQSALLEPVLVWGALGVHLVAALVRRQCLPRAPRCAWRDARWWHRLAGLALAPVLLLHVVTNRLVPSRSAAPMRELSPAELDMSYVSVGFAHYPRVSWLVYTWLCVCGAVHLVGGVPKLQRRHARTAYGMGAGIALAALLLGGTAAIARDTAIPRVLRERVVGCYAHVWPYAALR